MESFVILVSVFFNVLEERRVKLMIVVANAMTKAKKVIVKITKNIVVN